MKFGLTVSEIVGVNRRLGGALRLDSRITYAISAGKDKTDRQKLALLWRAILIDHPFTDANKRTVGVITEQYAEAHGYTIDAPRLVNQIIDVSKNNITELKKIERRIKYACTGD